MAILPANLYGASTTEDKTTLLQQATETKLSQLTNKRDAILLGLNDGDGPITSEGTFREQATNGMYYDANELPKPGFEADKSTKAMQYQDLLTARKVNKDVKDITDQDRLDVANWQQIQKLSDLTNGPGVWEAPFARGVEKTNLTGRYTGENGVQQEAPLNIPISVATNGQTDEFGRKLGQVGTSDGIDVTTASANNPELNARYRSASTNNGVDLTAAEIQRGREKAADQSITSKVANFIPGVAQGFGKSAILDTADFVGELTGLWDVGTEEQKNKMASKVTGFDDTYSKQYMQNIEKVVAKNMHEIPKDEKGWFDALVESTSGKDGVLTKINQAISNMDGKDALAVWHNATANSDATAQSIGVMIGLFAGTKGAGLGKVALKSGELAEDAIKAVKASTALTYAERSAQVANITKEAYEQANVLQKALNVLGKNSGMLTINAGAVNDQLDEFKQNTGRDATMQEVGEKYILNLGGMYLDRLSGANIMKGVISRETVDALSDIIKYSPKNAGLRLAKGAVSTATGLVSEMGAEFMQEGLQTAIEEVNKIDIRTEKGQQAYRDKATEILTAAFAGAGGALHMATPHTIAGIVTGSKAEDAVTAKLDQIKAEIDRRKAAKGGTTVEPGVSVEDRLAKAGSMMSTNVGSLDEVRQHLNGLEADIDAIDDVEVKQKYIDANKAYQERLSKYAKEVEATGKLDSRSYNAEPEFYLDLLAAATDKEAIAKAMEADVELKKNYGAENVAGLVKTLRDIDSSRNQVLDELVGLEQAATNRQTMSGTSHDIGNLGFATSADVYPSLAKYIRKSYSTGSVDDRLVDFAASQDDKLNRLVHAYDVAMNDTRAYIDSIKPTNMSTEEATKALAYLESRTAAGGKTGASVKNINEYVKLGAKLLGMPETSNWKAVTAAYEGSNAQKTVKNIKLVPAPYANVFIGRNDGKFEFNAYELIGDLAQTYAKDDKLAVSGAKSLIEQVTKEADVLNKIVEKSRLSAQTLAEMKQVFKLYKNDKGQVVTSDDEVMDEQDPGEEAVKPTDTKPMGPVVPAKPVEKEKEKAPLEPDTVATVTARLKQALVDVEDLKLKKMEDGNTPEQVESITDAIRETQQYVGRLHKKLKSLKAKEQNKAKGGSKKPKKTNIMREAKYSQTGVNFDEDAVAGNIQSALKMSSDDVKERDLYDDDTVAELDRIAEEAKAAADALDEKNKEELFALIDELAKQENEESAIAVIAEVQQMDIADFEVVDVEAAITAIRGSVFLNRVKELAGTGADVDVKSEEYKQFADILDEIAAKEKYEVDVDPAVLTKHLKQQANILNKQIDVVKGLVDKSKDVVKRAYALSKQVKQQLGPLNKLRADTWNKREVAEKAIKELATIKEKLERLRIVEASLNELAANAKEVAASDLERIRVTKEAIEKLVEQEKQKQGLVDSIPALDEKLKATSKTIWELQQKMDVIKSYSKEQKQLAYATMKELFAEIAVVRKAIKQVKEKYSGTGYTSDKIMKKRKGVTNLISYTNIIKKPETDTAVKVVTKAPIMNTYVSVASTKEGKGKGTRISNESAAEIVEGDVVLQQQLAELVDALENLVVGPNMKSASENKVSMDIVAISSPGTILLRNLNTGDKPIDPNVAMAVKIAMLEAVEDAALTGTDDDTLIKKFGESVVEGMSEAQKQALLEYGIPTKYIADKIGRRIMKLLGLRMKDSTSDGVIDPNVAEDYGRLIVSLGMYGVFLAQVEGKLKVSDMDMKEYLEIVGIEGEANKGAVMSLVKIEEGIKAEEVADEYDMWNRVLFLDDKIEDVVFYKPEVEELRQSNNEVTDMPKEAQDNMKDMMQQEWHLKGVDNKASAMYEVLNMNADTLMRLEGYDNRVDNAEERAKMPEQLQKTVRGRNLTIKKAVNGMKQMANKILSGLEKNSFWHKYSFAKSGRSFVQSEGFNGQGTKLHRHMLFSKEQMANVKLDVTNSDYKVTMLAIAQNMGVDTDKMSLNEAVRIGEALVDNQEDLELKWEKAKAEAAGTGPISEIKVAGEKLKMIPVSAFADALDAIRAINKAKAEGKDTVALTLTLEADGITNGFALKLLQVMWTLNEQESEFIETWLEKTGIKVWKDGKSGEKATKDGIAAMIGAGDIIDSYRTLATKMTNDKVNSEIENEIAEMIEKKQAAEVELLGKKLGLNGDTVVGGLQEIFAAATSVFGELQEGGKVTSFARLLMKPPFMTFMYGAGKKKMMMELADMLVDTLLEKISTYESLKETEKVAMDNLLALLLPNGMGAKQRIAWIRSYKAKGELDIDGNGVDPIDVMRAAFMHTYGTAAVGILNTEFAQMVKINEHIRESMSFVANIWQAAYKEKLVELAGEGNTPTKDQYLEALEATKDLFPVINGPFSKNEKEGIAIFKKQLATRLESSFAEDTSGKVGKVKAGQSAAYIVEGHEAVNKVLAMLVHEYVEAATAAAVIPIHTLDGAIISRAIKGKGVMQIFDALMLGIGQAVELTKNYNKVFYEINMKWNYLDEVVNSVQRTIERVNKTGNPDLTKAMQEQWARKGGKIKALQKDAKLNREAKKQLQKRGVTMSNMLLTKSAEYLAEINSKDDIIEGLNKMSAEDKAEVAKAYGQGFEVLMKDIKENC